ncbi:chromosome segregation protein SMC [Candidatus Woesearchaeota archaeon]|nr:chromosome segregation protein SMC [Candidatus Woesearchaeota archaeon]
MKGFKSFATKTDIDFGDNFNCILGPNGSGKSNVLDSLCFVLGKAGAKGLRVEKSSNLIYNGGKTKKPAKEGEVSIWFDNSENTFSQIDEKEVKITRIIKSNGQGVYKINDKTSTRTQIIDLLGSAHINPDGYNIILQGDIVRLIEMSPNERRQIIEEIAGINVYEDKKQKALREIGRVEEKINEADIILAERESYLKELKKDRDKAQKFKDLENKKKRNKKTLLVNDISTREEKVSGIDAQIEKHNLEITKIEEEIKSLRELISQKKKDIEAINKEVEEKGEKDQVKIHKEVEALKVDVALAKQRLQTIDTEIEKVRGRQSELKKDYDELNEKTGNLEQRKNELEKRISIREGDLSGIKDKIEEFKKKHNLDAESDADKQIDEMDKQLEGLQEEMNTLRVSQQDVLREKDRVDMQLQGIDERLAKLANVKEEHKKELEQLQERKKQFKQTTLDLNKSLALSSEYASQLATARSKIISKQEQLAKLEARKSAVLERLAGGSALKAILDLKKSEPGIHGTVAELGNVPGDVSLALEIAAGNKVKSIVVDDDKVAAKCIRYLKDKKLGVATFLPLNKIRAPPISDDSRKISGPGIKGLAIDLVSFSPEYKGVFEYVFGNTLVVDSIETARRVGIGKIRMATLTGDIAEMSGAMQGGFRAQKQEGGLFGQEEVNKQIEALNSDMADSQGVVFTLEQKSSDNDQLIQRLRNLKAELEGEIIKTEKSLHLDGDDATLEGNEKQKLADKAHELDSKIDEIQDTISEKNREFAQLKIQRQQLRDKVTDLRNPAKLAELKTFEEKRLELQTEIVNFKGELQGIIGQMDSVIGPEGRRILDIIKQHEKEEGSFVKEQLDIKEKVAKQQKELEAKEEQEKEFYEQFKELFNRRSKLSDEVNSAETKIATQNSNARTFELKNNALNLENAKLKAELAGLKEEDKDYQGVEPYTDKNTDIIKRELAEFERMKEQLGAVNMRALEIYEEVETEYHKLQEKKETLRKEREDVLLMMNEIDSKKKELFMRTFEALESNFQRIFSTLLMKGDASIVLENENDPFAGGVEIKVRLTGKRFMDIRSLSGGEKTMTALAFLFAVQEYQPASFYIMDEVDAALDKKNSSRLAELVRSYCDKAQYIVISHNDGVISEADNLYGVSMNEHGMSKVTSLKL